MAEEEVCGPPRDDYQARWGLESGCGRTHRQPPIGRNPMTLLNLGWVRLGQDDVTGPLTCSGWVPKGFDPMTYQARYQRFLIGMTNAYHNMEDPPTYVLKIPGRSAMTVSTDMEWRMAMHHLWAQMVENPWYWCKTQPPIVLACTPEQAARCEARQWIDSVRLEKLYTELEAEDPGNDGRGQHGTDGVDDTDTVHVDGKLEEATDTSTENPTRHPDSPSEAKESAPRAEMSDGEPTDGEPTDGHIAGHDADGGKQL